MPSIQFIDPYYTTAVRDYVAAPFPTGEEVRLWSDDGEVIASVTEPYRRWPELLAVKAREQGYPELTADVIESLDQSEAAS